MKSIHAHSLRIKIIISLIVISVLFLGIFQAYSYYSLKVQLINELNEAADSKIERLARDLEIPTWEIDELWVEKIVKSELVDEKVHAIMVSGDDNFVVGVDRDKDKDDAVKIHKEENIIVRTRSIMHNGVKIGAINLYLTKNMMTDRLHKELISALIVTLLETLVVIAFLWIMLRRVVLSPIEMLMESTKRIANGDYSHEPLMLEDDELGALAESIYQMKRKIELREQELSDNNSEMAALKERLEFAVYGSQDGLWDWNLLTNEVYFSPRWKAMLGYTDEELPNVFDSWIKLMDPDDIEKTQHAVQISHQAPGRFYENLHRLRHKDGSWVWILTRGQTIFNAEGKPVRMVGFHTDVTKQKELEQELLEKEEMMIVQSRHVAMGEMIGMIAHQWRQPITVIAMGANNMLADIELESVEVENFKHEAQQILKQTEYLSKTIDDFRTFFRPNKEKNEIKVLDVLLEAKQIMGKSLENHNIELTFVDNSDEIIFTYSRELLQVILNLVKNAKEALEASKTEDAYIHVTIENIADDVVITVCDNGSGIDQNIIGRIFDPYFSTKDAKTGTGLGLYMSKTIIEKHLHGLISAANSDKGACFTVTLPRTFNGESENE